MKRLGIALLLAGGVVAGAVVLWLWLSAERRAIERLSPHERIRAVQLVTEELRTLCSGAVDPGLLDRCRQQAEFVVKFPECQDSCRQRAAPFLPEPSR